MSPAMFAHAAARGPSSLFADADFPAIAELVPHMVWVARTDGFTDYMNRRARAFTGMSLESITGWNWLDVVHPEDSRRAKTAWERATRTEGPYEIQYRLRDRDGVYRWTNARAQPVLDDEGRVTRWVGTWTEIDDFARPEPQVSKRATRRLSRREIEILALAADGHTGPQIARELVVSPSTVKTHFENIYSKLGVSDRTAAVAYALRARLID